MLKRQLPAFRVAILALVLVTGGCSTPRERDRAAERSLAPRVSLAGEQRFFDDKLLVSATVRHRDHPGFAGKTGGDADAPRRRHSNAGSGGGARRRMAQGEAGQPAGPRMRLGGAPALILRVTLHNTSNETLTLAIRDVKSDLGNFAARPERVTLEPQQSVELDPMFSMIDSVGGDIPLTIALRSSQQTETQTLVLRPTPPAEPAPRAD